jgi:hypothetical protein
MAAVDDLLNVFDLKSELILDLTSMVDNLQSYIIKH